MPDLELIESLAWAPDTRELACIGTGSGQSDLYTINVDTGERRQITGTPQREDHPNWSPDGQHIAFSSKYHNQFDIKIYDMAEGTSRTVVSNPNDDLWPQWLPEGNKLLFVSTRDKINDLFVYHLDEEREYRLTRSLSGIMNPALSPDGRQIVFSSYFKGRGQLYLMDMPEWPGVKRKNAELLARVESAQKPPLALDDMQVPDDVALAFAPTLNPEPPPPPPALFLLRRECEEEEAGRWRGTSRYPREPRTLGHTSTTIFSLGR